MKLLLLLPALAALAFAPSAHGARGVPVQRGFAEHTVQEYTLERGGVVERRERAERWVSSRRARVVYTDPSTGRTLGACTGTRRRIRCFGRDPQLELAPRADQWLFLPSWAETARFVRRGLARGWVTQTGFADHRGTPARRLEATPEATGDAGTTTLLAERTTLALLFRQTRSPVAEGEVVSTEDVLERERLRAGGVDWRLHAPPGARVRTARP
jgi:hypothetical protein